MKAERLIEMANDIAAFFAAEPDEEAAIAGVADHLRRFWDPRMRSGIVGHVRQTGGGELHPVALEAVRRLAADAVNAA